MSTLPISTWDRILIAIAPEWAAKRFRARHVAAQIARHYDAASLGRRTQNWSRAGGDADVVIRGAFLELRIHARDLIRNNSWARRGQSTIANNTVGWGIMPKPVGGNPQKAMQLWKAWADSTQCESEGRHTFPSIQALCMNSVPVDGEILIRRRYRRPTDNLTLPLQLQVLEADFLDHAKQSLDSLAGGPIIQGVEFDLLGRRAAYWLFEQHPGSGRNVNPSRRIPADDVIHLFRAERPGQTRGVSWFGSAIVPLKDLDEYEDATLMRQKIAACFAAFVTDDGAGAAIGEQSVTDELIETFEPGMIQRLTPGKNVVFGNPPTVTESGFDSRNLRRIAAGLGVTYEDLTGDYSQVNFSSGRMGRLAHWANVTAWQWHMLIPILCQRVWEWAMEAAVVAGELQAPSTVEWITPAMPTIEPDKEALGTMRRVRTGQMTFSQMVREQGYDPDAHFAEYAADLKRLTALGITLDSDAGAVSQAGQVQVDPSAAGEAAPPSAKPAPKKREADDFDIDVDVPDDLAREVLS